MSSYKAGGQEQHQWFRPSSLVLPVLTNYCDDVPRNNSGNLAKSPQAAMPHRGLSILAAERRPGSSSKQK